MSCISGRHKLPYLNVFCKINLSWCNFKLNFNRHSINSIKSHLALNYCSTAHDCSGLVVDCQWPGGLWTPVPISLLDRCEACCPQLPLPGDLCQFTYFYCRLCTICCSFLIFTVFNTREGLTAISTCERGTGKHSLRQAHCERLSTISSL